MRIVALLLALTIVGAIPYVFLWLTLPSGDPVAAAMAPPQSQSPLSRGNTTSTPGQHPEERQHTVLGRLFGNTSKPKLIAGLGIILLLLALFMLIGNVRPAVVIPALLFLTGIGLSWIQTGDSSLRIPLLLTSLGLILASVITFLLSTLPLNRALTMMSVAAILLLGITAVAVPWIGSLIHQLSRESALKEREEERADMTAHLHDGVLQTLALIQLHADNPQTVFTLARSQERDLRNWLYQDRTPSERSVGTGIRDIAAEIEDSFGRPIEVATGPSGYQAVHRGAHQTTGRYGRDSFTTWLGHRGEDAHASFDSQPAGGQTVRDQWRPRPPTDDGMIGFCLWKTMI